MTVCIDALPVTVWFLVLLFSFEKFKSTSVLLMTTLFFAFLLSSTSKHNDASDYL